MRNDSSPEVTPGDGGILLVAECDKTLVQRAPDVHVVHAVLHGHAQHRHRLPISASVDECECKVPAAGQPPRRDGNGALSMQDGFVMAVMSFLSTVYLFKIGYKLRT